MEANSTSTGGASSSNETGTLRSTEPDIHHFQAITGGSATSGQGKSDTAVSRTVSQLTKLAGMLKDDGTLATSEQSAAQDPLGDISGSIPHAKGGTASREVLNLDDPFRSASHPTVPSVSVQTSRNGGSQEGKTVLEIMISQYVSEEIAAAGTGRPASNFTQLGEAQTEQAPSLGPPPDQKVDTDATSPDGPLGEGQLGRQWDKMDGIVKTAREWSGYVAARAPFLELLEWLDHKKNTLREKKHLSELKKCCQALLDWEEKYSGTPVSASRKNYWMELCEQSEIEDVGMHLERWISGTE